jgi:hypothetical protein
MGRLANDGTFTFGAVEPAPYEVTVLDPNSNASLPLVKGPVFAPTSEVVTLVIATAKSLSGMVVDRSGRPVSRAWVVAVGEGRVVAGPVVSDDRGRFQLPGVAPESTVRLVGGHDDHGRTELDGVTLGAAGLRLELRPAPKIDIRVANADGTPARGHGLVLVHESGAPRYTLTTDASGRATSLACAEGAYTVVEAADTATALGTVRGGGPVELRLAAQ